jgi:NADH/NAD ratio-sensing transcriptional regulator Rex
MITIGLLIHFKYVKEEKHSRIPSQHLRHARSTPFATKREDLSDIVAWGEGGNGFVIKSL